MREVPSLATARVVEAEALAEPEHPAAPASPGEDSAASVYAAASIATAAVKHLLAMKGDADDLQSSTLTTLKRKSGVAKLSLRYWAESEGAQPEAEAAPDVKPRLLELVGSPTSAVECQR